MKKRFCDAEQKETSWKEIDTETPQGYPQKIEECQGCHMRIQTNDPEADFIAAGGKIGEDKEES